ncbi:MAG TPA: hypothetical protein VK540_30115 [Polyangiaceae bacterium]|nr:hypothetical protein [Polyangiaceae bacterium]
MSRQSRARWSGAAWPFGGLVLAVLGLVSCGSPAKPAPSIQVGDRRELPAVSVAPADAGGSRSPSASPAPPAFPRAGAVGALSEGERIADLTALAVGDRFLLAWVTYFDGGGPALRASSRGPAKKGATPGPQQQRGATVVVRALDAEGEALGAANVISVKADSIGGVSLAAGASAQGDAGLAWVGKDAGIGQVFVTRLSRSGEKQAQRMVTRSKEGCSDVALVRHKDGFVVAYIDSRDGLPGVYTVKVGKDLQRIGNERLVAQVKGEASDVRMIARGEDLVVAWAEARRDPDLHGVFAARLLAADLAVRGDPARVVLGPQHARGIELAAVGEGLALGWVEDAGPGTGAATTSEKTAMLVGLDFALRAAGEPVRVALPAQASSLALECDRSCRVVVAGSEGENLAFYGFLFERGAPQPAARLTAIAGVSTEDANPVVARDWLFFAEDNLRGSGRIRKAKLAWR